MKRFTNFILVVVFFFAALTNMDAQRIYGVTITEPDNIAGTYNAVPGGFGSQEYCSDTDPLVGELAIAMNAEGATTVCDTVVTDLTGKIALIDRGTCAFVDKALNAQAKGAIGVIVCNNNNEPPFAMGGSDDNIVIPCFMMSKADCDLIRVEIPTVTVSLAPIYPDPYSGDVVLWGDQPGQGDFDGGMNGWTVHNTTTCAASDYWVWDPTGDAQEGMYGGGALCASPTACNGVMEFNSDYWDNNGCAAPQTGELISPVIDLSGFDVAGVSLKFFNSTRQYQSSYYVAYSNDGGATWLDTVAVNTELEVNSPHINNIKKIPLVGCAGSSQVVVKFIMEANYYYWMIDDVQIVEQEAYNMSINEDWYAVPQNYSFPQGQEEAIYFMTDVLNEGAEASTNVNVNVSIKDAGGNVLFSDNIAYGTVPGNSTDENRIFENEFTPDGLGEYSGAYVITADSVGPNLEDDTLSFNFKVTDHWFAKENGGTTAYAPSSSNWNDGDPHTWTIGNVYHIVQDFVVDLVTFGLSGEGNDGKEMIMYVYEWDDTNTNGKVESEERTKIGVGYYTVTGSETESDIINVEILDIEEETDAITLEGGKDYLVMVEYTAEADETVYIACSDEIYYDPMVYANASDDVNRPRYAYVWGANADLDNETYETNRFSTPTVRLKGHLATDINNLLSDDNKLTVSPNPATTAIQLSVDLVNGFDRATIKITDVTGKLITTRTVENVKTNTYSFDTSDFAAGTYFATLTTAEGAKTVKFVVSK